MLNIKLSEKKELAPKSPQKSNIKETTTDITNPEQNNPRYYRSWWQKKFASWFKINLAEPRYHTHSKHFMWRHFERLQKFKKSYPKTGAFLQYLIPLLLLATIPFAWMVLPSLLIFNASLLLAIQIIVSAVASISTVLLVINKWVGDNVFGKPVKAFDHLYKNAVLQLRRLGCIFSQPNMKLHA
jgi:hypothetical protein